MEAFLAGRGSVRERELLDFTDIYMYVPVLCNTLQRKEKA